MKTLRIVSFGIKNNRVLAGFMLLICGFVCPVFAVMADRGSYHSTLTDYIPVFGTAAAYFAGLLFPIVFFSYTHNRRMNDFYAAMPVKKRQYFWGYFLAGIILFIVPLFIMDTILGMLAGVRGSLELSYFVGPLAVFFSIYCSMTLAVMFSGSVVSTVITFLLRNIFVVCLVAPILFMAGVDISSYYMLLYDKVIVTIPLLGFLPFFDVNTLWWVWIWQFGIGILEIAVAFFLHKYRRSEATMALAFPKSRYPYQYIVTLMFVMAVNTVMLIILGLSNGTFNNYDSDGRFNWGSNDLKTLIFFDVIGALLMFILLNIVLERSSRAAFKKIRHLVFFFAGFFAIAGVSSKLLSYIPKVYTPIEPDYAIVSVYRPVDSSSIDPDSEEFETDLMTGRYVGTLYYEYDEETDENHKVIEWLLERDEQFIVTSHQKLKELVKICEGRVEYYNVRSSNSYNSNYGGTVHGYSSYNPNYYGTEAMYFDILLAEGDYDLTSAPEEERVCTSYNILRGLERSGYVFGSSSGLDAYKDYTFELPERLN